MTKKQAQQELNAAVEALASMQYPSLAQILTSNGYNYEAQQVNKVITAYENYVKPPKHRSQPKR